MKRIFILLVVSLFLKGIFAQIAPQGVPMNPDYINYLQDLQNGLVTNVTPDGHGLGYIPSRVKPDFTGYTSVYSPTTLPSIFDLRTNGKMTSVKDQGSCGSCWCFATMGSMESRWKVLGLGDNDLSENNLKNCHLYDAGPCDGGNFSMSSAYMARRSGPISETSDPYSPSIQSCLQGLTPVAYETSACFLPNDINMIKQTLMDNGAIYTAFYWNDSYYNASNYTYYYNGSNYSNHAVTIAGWDDTKVTAGGTGAWIIKNSWGSSWGESGYFYISYNDSKILDENGYFPTRIAYEGNTKIYNYDDFGMFASYGFGNTIGYGLVKFISTNTYPVIKIGTWINASNASYDIEVYDNFSGGTLSGLLGSIYNQSSLFPGYYLFNLPIPISMTNGNDFYVKIKYTTSGFNYPIPIEEVSPGYASNVTIQTGVCWFSSNGTSWTAIGGGTSYPYDLCIKAYASQQSSDLPPVVDFTANNLTPIVNQTLYFTDQSSNTPTSWQWTITPATFSYVDGTSSASQNPHITFSAAGFYTVTLQATNAFGTGSLTKTNYIDVLAPPSTGWIEQASGFSIPSRGINDVFCVNSNVVWAAAYDGTNFTNPCNDFTRTVNGGTLWTAGTITGCTGLSIANICAIDGNTAWTCMYNPGSGTLPHGIYKTINGGSTWARQTSALFSNAVSFPDCVHFWDANDGWCLGDPINGEFEIYMTTNGGTSWTLVPGSQIPNPLSGEFGIVGYYSVSGNTVWFGTNKGRVYKSTDKGYNWTVYQVPGWTAIYTQPFFKDAIYGLAMDKTAGTTIGNLVNSFDGGTSWTPISPTTGGNFSYDMAYVPGSASTWVVTGADATNSLAGVRYSFDNGITWNDMSSTIGTQFLATDWVNDSTGWAGGFNTNATTGGIYKFIGHLAPGLLPPTNLQAVLTMNNVHLSWNAPVGVTGLTGYNVYRNGTKINATTVTTLFYNDNGLAYGTYSYTVKALYGTVESTPAGPVEINLTDPTTYVGNTRYDQQTNASNQNRLYSYSDGTLGATYTMGFQESTFPDRGTGYNYFNGTSWGTAPAARVETVRTGWPSLAPFGTSGELIVAHQSGTLPLVISKRATKGTGTWVESYLNPPSGATGLLWPRMVTNGPNHNYIHIIAMTAPTSNGGGVYQGLDGAILYARSLDGGTTWSDWQILPGMTSAQYLYFTADGYSWAEPKGDTLCFTVGGKWHDQFIMKSLNNGVSWTKTVIWPCAYNLWNGTTATPDFYCSDGSTAIALDNNGKAHVIFGRQKAYGDATGAEYMYYFTDGLIYWNENNPQLPQSLDSAALVAGGNWLANVQNPGVWTSGNLLAAYYNSLSSMPCLVIDNYNDLFAVWSGVTTQVDPDGYMLRHLYARGSSDGGVTWCPNIIDLTSSSEFSDKECVYPGIAAKSSSTHLDMIFQMDSLAGTAIWNAGTNGQSAFDNNIIEFMSIQKGLLLCGSSNLPTNLIAASGFKYCIPLTWKDMDTTSLLKNSNASSSSANSLQSENSLTVDYYKIYRKTGSSGSYSLIGNTLNYYNFIPPSCYVDINVTPGVTYYYKVTAVITGVETGYSTEVSASCNTLGFTSTAVNSSTTPVIDGIINPGEWSEATVINITNTLGYNNPPPFNNVYAYLKTVGNYLYIAVKDLADTANGSCEVGIYFDNNSNHIYDNMDGNFWIERDTNGVNHIKYRQMYGTYPYNVTFETTIENPTGVIAAIGMNGGHREYEVKIDLNTSPLQPVNNTLGFYLFTWERSPNSYNGYWPGGNEWADPETYAELTIQTASLSAPVTTAGIKGSPANALVHVPITVTNFNNNTALSLRLEYDPTILSFSGFSNANPLLSGIMVNDLHISATLHRIMMIWSDINPVTLLPNSRILDLDFNYSSGTSALTWNNDANGGADCEYADANGDPLIDVPTSLYYINGEVHWQPGNKVSGNFHYNNTALTTLDNLKVVLKQNNLHLDSIITNINGYYEFNSVPNNTYTLQTYCNKPWQGVNGTDAIKIQRHFTGLEFLTEPVRLLAGDVNLSNSINGTDAVKVKRRFTGLDTTFTRGNWTFAKPTIGGDTIIVNGSDVTQDFFGLCVGDVNGSNIPSAGKSDLNKVELISQGSIEVKAGQMIEVPVRIKNPGQFGAISLVFTYPEELFTIEKVTMNKPGIFFKVIGDKIRIAWSDLDALDLVAGDPLVTLHLKATDKFSSSSVAELSLASESEIADGWGNAVPLVVLSAPKLVFTTGGESIFENFKVYPNPASEFVNIEFTLSEAADLSVEILNIDGTLADNWTLGRLASGRHLQTLDLSKYSNGIYFLRISLRGNIIKIIKIIKIT